MLKLVLSLKLGLASLKSYVRKYGLIKTVTEAVWLSININRLEELMHLDSPSLSDSEMREIGENVMEICEFLNSLTDEQFQSLYTFCLDYDAWDRLEIEIIQKKAYEDYSPYDYP